MAKKWGRRKKARKATEVVPDAFLEPQEPVRGTPASGTPLADYLAQGWPGTDDQYTVLPRTLAESMPLPWQRRLAELLTQFYDAHAGLSWPEYWVTPARSEQLVNLDEEQLAEAGYLVEMDSEGGMVYRERSGRKVDDPENTTVLVSCLDPIVQPSSPAPGRSTDPAPMNVGPEPAWQVGTSPTTNADVPPLPPPPRRR